MSTRNIIRAWKDASYRNSLSDAERAALPPNPAGSIAEATSCGSARSLSSADWTLISRIEATLAKHAEPVRA